MCVCTVAIVASEISYVFEPEELFAPTKTRKNPCSLQGQLMLLHVNKAGHSTSGLEHFQDSFVANKNVPALIG